MFSRIRIIIGLKAVYSTFNAIKCKLTFPEDTTYLEGMIEKYQLAIPQILKVEV